MSVPEESPGYVPLDTYDKPIRRRGHSPFIVNGRPADLQPLPTIDPLAWDREPIPERRWIVPGLIPEANVTMLNGDGGLGKSQLALQLLAACTLGKNWIGHEVRRCKAIGLFCEDDHDELHRRLADILQHYGASFADLEDLKLVCRVDQENLLIEFRDQWSAGETTALYQRLQTLVTEHGCQLLVVDSLHDLFGGNENSRSHARQFVGGLRSIALGMEGAVLLTAHPSLSGRNSGTGEAGSTAWNNAVRSRLYLTAPKRDDEEGANDFRELKTMKSNYASAGGVIRLQWNEGIFIRADAPLSPVNTVDRIALDNAVVDAARDLIKGGVRLLADKNAVNSLANRVRQDERCKAQKWATIAAAQERLISSGRLVRVELGPPSRRMVYVRPSDTLYPGEVG